MNEEVKDLALLALRNAFYTEFSALVNEFLSAAEGLNVEEFETQLSETANVFSRDLYATGDNGPNVWTQNKGSRFNTSGHRTILEALEHKEAKEVHLNGTRVFERRNGEWYYIGE